MGKKVKTGKSRKDKFYHLAKETGYRARSAFKLIQLNRKYEFLQKSRVVIDLCAAPGGWLQVVAENAPVSSLIVGVDLVPIRPIPNCITLQEDITTDKCRQALKKELQTWKADAVLHDGAPNVGKNWLHDAYQQAQLTLEALKLATMFLKKGGWFVTKVFRSKDYFSLIWVFQQLFGRVHATKPQASRNESAEIFVVCERFLAPDRIDPKFFDTKHVFKEVEEEPKTKLNLIHPEKKQRQREGYPTGDYTLHHKLTVTEFLTSDNYLELLAQANEVVLDNKEVDNHPETTDEIRECLKDIKVLGKKEIKNLMKWRLSVRKLLSDKEESSSVEKVQNVEMEEEEEEEDEEAEIEAKLAEAQEAEKKMLKKKLKKIRQQKAKLRHKMDLKFVLPGDKHDFSDDLGLFHLSKLKSKQDLDTVEEGDNKYADEFAAEDDDDEEEDLTPQQRKMTYDKEAKSHLDGLYSSEEDDSGEAEPDIGNMEDSDALEFEGDEKQEDKPAKKKVKNPLLVSLDSEETKTQSRVNSWFSKDSFAGIDDDADEDEEIEKMIDDYKKKGGTIKDLNQKKDSKTKSKVSNERDQDGSDDDDDDDESDDEEESSDEESSSSDSDFDTKELMKTRPENFKLPNKSGFEEVPASEKLDAVGLAIGAAMVQSRKRRREVTESGYHRYMYSDENLPDWFVKDEEKHCRIQLPVSKGEVEEYKLKERSINARPIKKVAEAKARKKKKEMKRLERARKKAEVIADSADTTERDKWQQIKQIYKKAGLLSKKKKEVAYVVAKKGIGRRVSRPKGIQGPFRVVDPRMKKDFMSRKKEAKTKGKGRGKKGGARK